LYKIWNRMSSGSYFPPAVKAVEIPKKAGGTRRLGIPTVSERIAQMVAKMYMEPYVEMIFQEDSYGYRPNKSALNAVGKARQRCLSPVRLRPCRAHISNRSGYKLDRFLSLGTICY
jgi:retron-type reverse transcriptase